MKPSERIAEIAAALLVETERTASPRNFIRYEREYRESAILRAVIQYLDGVAEQRKDGT